MKRKVIKQGNNTLTITLPREWTSKYGIKAGDELEMSEQNQSLVLGGHKNADEQKIAIDVSELDRSTIMILLQGLYRYGYDYIEISTSRTTVPHFRVSKEISLSALIYDTTNRLVGAEVISASPKKYVIKRIAQESIEDFPVVLRRIFLLVNEMIETFIHAAEADDAEAFKSIEFHHSNVKKFINFCLRLLNKYGYEDTRKTCFYFNIISLLSKSEDIIKNNSRYVMKQGIVLKSRNSIDMLKEIRNSLRMYYEFFYSYKLEKMTQLNRQRDTFRDKLFKSMKDMSKEENMIVGGMSQIVELILDMTELRMALEG